MVFGLFLRFLGDPWLGQRVVSSFHLPCLIELCLKLGLIDFSIVFGLDTINVLTTIDSLVLTIAFGCLCQYNRLAGIDVSEGAQKLFMLEPNVLCGRRQVAH